jgi:hypothetical protein
MTSLRCLLLASMLIAAAPACGDDDDDTGSDGGATSGGSGEGAGHAGSHGDDAGDVPGTDAGGSGSGSDSISIEITAADGGEVALGEASLSIPGGSLASDTTITLETSAPSSALPESDSVQGLVYDLGPDGTQFSEPATLTLPAVGKPGADEQAVISWLDESTDSWQDLATTVNADGSLSAEITHFTNFAVRFNGVESTDCGFSACGGDIVGTWRIKSVCAELSGALIDVCPTAIAMVDLTLDGAVTFDADGTRSSELTGKSTITYTLDADCLDAITMGMPPDSCDVLSKEADPSMDKGPTTCSGDPTVACTCVEDNPESTETKTGTYTVEGNTLTSTDDADGTVTMAELCVQGTEARVQETEDLAILTWIAEKQ